MGKTTKAKAPRPGKFKRPTTLSFDPEMWERLKAIEEETGAKPSVIVSRILDKALPPIIDGTPAASDPATN